MGIIFLTMGMLAYYTIKRAMKFPSPYGDYFFNQTIYLIIERPGLPTVFPSPYGDYFFNQISI